MRSERDGPGEVVATFAGVVVGEIHRAVHGFGLVVVSAVVLLVLVAGGFICLI
jgi:hypothetical protein